MRRFALAKALLLTCAVFVFCYTANARPEFLALFAADPYSRPELRSKCSVCHINPAGGGERNDFGKAFAAAGFKITPALRAAWPDRFVVPGQTAQTAQSQAPQVTFVPNSQSEAIVEYGGKKLLINTRDQTVRELATDVRPTGQATGQTTAPEPPDVFVPVDVRLINLPTAIPIPKGSLWTDFTHRFPFGDVTQASQLLGLDSFAAPSFGVTYGLTDRIQIGAYRSPTLVGRPIEMFAGIHLLDETKGQPLTVMARVSLEGRDNFQRNFTTSFEATVAKSITRHAQIYVVPTVSIGDRPIGQPEVNLPGTTAVALGVGAAVNVRPSIALMAEVNYRFNEDSRYEVPGPGIRRPVFGFGLQKASASRRHAFSLIFTNGPGTTFAQRSMTNALLFTDDSFKNLSIGFNLTRRIF
jgi:hypothetical protein